MIQKRTFCYFLKLDNKRACLLKMLCVVGLISISSNLFGQSQKFKFNHTEIVLDNKLVSHFDADYLEKLKTQNPATLLYLNFFSSNSYKIIDAGEKTKLGDYKLLSELVSNEKNTNKNIISSNINDFNILSYEIYLLDNQQIINLEKNNLVLIIDSKKEFLDKYNNYMNSIK